MSAIAEELVELVDGLPEDKAREVIDFARFLKQQASDLKWEEIISDNRLRPKLDAFVTAALNEGHAEPLDPSKL